MIQALALLTPLIAFTLQPVQSDKEKSDAAAKEQQAQADKGAARGAPATGTTSQGTTTTTPPVQQQPPGAAGATPGAPTSSNPQDRPNPGVPPGANAPGANPAAPPAPGANAPGGRPANAPVQANRGQNPPSSSSGGQGGGKMPDVRDDGDYWIVAFDETEGCDLESLTKICQQTTGINFTYDQKAQDALAKLKVKIFGQKRFPKSEFYSFYQIILFINGYVCTKVGPDMLSLVVIQEVNAPAQQGKSSLKSESVYVLPEELDRYQGQVATQIITVLHLPHTDVRSLGNSLRILSPDTQTGGVIPVGTTNSVILQGFASNVISLARILKLVDDESANDAAAAPVFDVLPLEFAAAQDISDTLGQLLEAKQRQTERSRTQPGAAGAPGTATAGGGETKILVDARTNSLLVMALPEDLQQIKELVARLDIEVVEPERTYHVYVLENVKAKDLAQVIQDFLQDASRVQQGGAAGRAQPGGNAAIAQGNTSRDSQTVVVPDEATNSLLIAASKTRYEEMLALIQKLDERQDQVLIETALVELSGSDFRDLGVELGGADIPGLGQLGSFGVTSFGLSTLQDTNGDGAPDLRSPILTNGITAGILDGDSIGQLPILLQAIKTISDTNILNVPSVLVNNNGSAKVASKDEQPTTTITATGGAAGQTQENFNKYEEAGITMQISPSISNAGYLRLDLFLEVSTFGAKDPSDGRAIPPPKLTRTLETSVNVPNGDTMVIGGIITDNKSESRTSIPWLGDLPVVGWLFRRDTDTANRITLYFFVTPHILRDKDFADLAQLSYEKKLAAADKIGADRIRVIDPRFGASTAPGVRFEGFELPLYGSPARGEVQGGDVGIDAQKRAKMTTPPGGDVKN
jgi:general secretion pathway protein D